jgi:hypothetical protein
MPTQFQAETLSDLSLPEPIPSAYTDLGEYYDALDRKGTSHRELVSIRVMALPKLLM